MKIAHKKLRRIIREETEAFQYEKMLREQDPDLLLENPIAAVVLQLLKNPQVVEMLTQLLLPKLMGGLTGGGASAGTTGTGGAIGATGGLKEE